MRWTTPVEVDHYYELEVGWDNPDDDYDFVEPTPFLASRQMGGLLALMPFLSRGGHFVGLDRYSIVETHDTETGTVHRYCDYRHSYGRNVRRGVFIAGWLDGEDITDQIVEDMVAAWDERTLRNA